MTGAAAAPTLLTMAAIAHWSFDRAAVIGDLHGRLDLLDELLDRLDDRQLVVIGDVIDRGPDSRAVVDRLIARRAVGVRGNHEEWMLAWLRGEGLDEWAIKPKMGGLATARSYEITGDTCGEIEPQKWRVPDAHRRFFESLALVGDLVVDGTAYWLIHAGVPVHISLRGVPFEQVVPWLAEHHGKELLWSTNDPEAMPDISRARSRSTRATSWRSIPARGLRRVDGSLRCCFRSGRSRPWDERSRGDARGRRSR